MTAYSLWMLEERRNHADLIEVFNLYRGYTSVVVVVVVVMILSERRSKDLVIQIIIY